MNARTDNLDELRDCELSRLTAIHAARIRSLAASGEPITLARIADAWTSTLENNELTAQIVRTDAAAMDALGALIHWQIDQAVHALAETDALKDLECMEADRIESQQEARADRGAWDRAMAAAFAGALAIAMIAPADAATITSKPGASTVITITTCPRFAGAICSLVAGRTKHSVAEHVNVSDHGRQCQSAVSLDYQGEGRNPTEAGSMRDGAGPTSTSRLLYEIADGQRLHTQTQMAYWYPWQGAALSNYMLEKRVQIGVAGMDNVIEYLTEYTMPRNEVAGHAVFEALTCYMPTYFSHFTTYEHRTGRVAPLDFTPGEQSLPIIAQTYGGIFAMGIYSPDSPQPEYATAGYGRWRHPDTTKWNNVFRVNNPSGTYKFRSYIIVGTSAEVIESMRKLHEIFRGQK